MKVFLIILCIILVLILLLIVLADIGASKTYKSAPVANGVVVECLGSEVRKGYGRYQYKKYWIYKIQYSTPIGVFTGDIPIDNPNLKQGSVVQVKYIEDETGVRLLDDVAPTRLRMLLIALPLGILWSLFCIWYTRGGF